MVKNKLVLEGDLFIRDYEPDPRAKMPEGFWNQKVSCEDLQIDNTGYEDNTGDTDMNRISEIVIEEFTSREEKEMGFEALSGDDLSYGRARITIELLEEEEK